MNFSAYPPIIHVPAEASKNGFPYKTCLIQHPCRNLIAYLKERQVRGETLTPESPLIASLQGSVLTRNSVLSDLIRPAVKRVLPRNRAYSLRSFFDMALQTSQVHPRWQSFFMGHSGDIESVYTTRKKLPPELLDKIREVFKPVEAHLLPQSPSREERIKTHLRERGFSDQQIEQALEALILA